MAPVDDHHDYIYDRLGTLDKKVEDLEFTVDFLKDLFGELSDSVLTIAKRVSRLERAGRMSG
jgi:hypothetical protein